MASVNYDEDKLIVEHYINLASYTSLALSNIITWYNILENFILYGSILTSLKHHCSCVPEHHEHTDLSHLKFDLIKIFSCEQTMSATEEQLYNVKQCFSMSQFMELPQLHKVWWLFWKLFPRQFSFAWQLWHRQTQIPLFSYIGLFC